MVSAFANPSSVRSGRKKWNPRVADEMERLVGCQAAVDAWWPFEYREHFRVIGDSPGVALRSSF